LWAAAPALRSWDARAARSADQYLANSTTVAARIKRVYGIDADVVPAPVPDLTTGVREPVEGVRPGFVLSVGRLLPYKNVHIVVEAFAKLPDQRLVVVGDGPERARLAQLAGPNVTLVGEVSDAPLRWLYERSAGVVSASHEDYGLTPLEANSFGKPCAVLRAGGFIDTVVDGRTGIFFDEPTPLAAGGALSRMLGHAWSTETLTTEATKYASAVFIRAMTEQCGGPPVSHHAEGAARA
jgi:glycosyltransferase involved in cell wall biosynthesis